MQKFTIQLKEPCLWEGIEPPEDSFGELTELQRRLLTFLYQQNRRVSIEVGDQAFDVFFDPDIAAILDELPRKISDLSLGNTIRIGFPESYFDIEFAPAGSQVWTTSRRFGYVVESEQFLLDRALVLQVLQQFLKEIMTLAIDGGHISPQQGQDFMADIDD